jgi:hypothetical protein
MKINSHFNIFLPITLLLVLFVLFVLITVSVSWLRFILALFRPLGSVSAFRMRIWIQAATECGSGSETLLEPNIC